MLRQFLLATVVAGAAAAAVGAPDCSFPGEPLADAAVRFERLSQGYRRPVDILFAPDRPDHYFVVEQPGTVKMVDRRTGQSTVSLAMTDGVDDSGNEMGLLGLAFHPRFTQTRRVFLNYTPGAARPQNKLLIASGKNISSFGEDLAGELYALDHQAGEVMRIVPAGTPPAGQFPRTLAATGCFRTLSPLIPADGLVAYDVNAPLWSDGAEKDRYVKAPAGTKIQYRAQGSFDFPAGTVLVKSFHVPQSRDGATVRRIVETRFLVKKADGFKGYTYRWNDQQTDAVLLAGAATRRLAIATAAGDELFDYYYPSTGDCNRCHVPAAGGALGFTSLQLNKGSQLQRLGQVVLTGVPADTASLPRLVDPANVAAADQSRARSYLHAQCANCHNQDTGTAQGEFDLRYELPLASARLCDEPPLAGDLGIPGAKILKPGDSAKSLLWVRAHSLDRLVRMPPLATSRRDVAGTAVLKAWIDGLSSQCL